ncbi:MAG: acyl-CoA synthetase [Acetobacteraceae bacterium]|nr:acyl-CoA synthetase [Acetobacteraceae bacterium]
MTSSSSSAPKGGIAPVTRRVMNLSHVLRQAARRHPAALGLVWGERCWQWAEIDRRVDAVAWALAERGVAKGDRVLVQARNGNQLVESMFACFRLGAVWVPTNFRQTPEDIAYVAASSGASVMIWGEEFAAHHDAVRALPSVRLTLSLAEFDALDHAGPRFPTCDVEHDDPCWFFYTSGSTGRPKAAVLTHGQMGFVINNHLCDLMPGMTPDDASLVVAPLSHGAGIHLLVQVARAVKSILPASDRLDPAVAWSLVERWQVTNMFTVPTILKLLVEHPAVHEHDHSSLRTIIYAGAPMYRQDQKTALRVLGKVLVQYFGLGEVTGNITVLPPALHDPDDEALAGSCGYERTGMQISIQDGRGDELPAGETGEICVCGLAVFAGYYQNDEANAKAFRRGWFRTGDLGYLDAAGFLFITGRDSDMYISGGSNVYPREIEEKLLAHPAIAAVAVVGMPDPVWGEVGVVAAVLRAGAQASEADLLAWLGPKIARYKLPRRVVFWETLPTSAYGKVTKALVRDKLRENLHPS